MGTKLSTSSKEFAPTIGVNVRGEEGQFFIGVLTAHKSPPSQYKKQDGSIRNHEVYEFELEDTDMELTVKKGNGYALVKDAEPGTPVAVFAPTRLHNGLSQAKIGDRLSIKYLGLGKAGKMGGKPHTYEVEII